jgi:50S ribosomal subunit-associated GTPase HflX
MNKADMVEASFMETLCRRHDAVAVSALRREGLDQLIQVAEAKTKNATDFTDSTDLHGYF